MTASVSLVHRPARREPQRGSLLEMLTAAASRYADRGLDCFPGVASRAELATLAIDARRVTAQVRAHRWQSFGSAIVLHNDKPDVRERRRIAMINCGPRAVLTSFTVADEWGLRGWERDEIHVLAPAGTRRPHIAGLVLHRQGNWDDAAIAYGRRLHLLEPALILAASSFASARPGCGLLAATVQQRMSTAVSLRAAVTAATRARHRAALLLALDDIAQGAQALSEIDFAVLCRRAGLPPPARQAVRVERDGRRRYLDVEWVLPSGRRVAVEVDGALHLSPRRWYDDQLRQNEVALSGTMMLRYPSVVVRTEATLVEAQLRRALLARS